MGTNSSAGAASGSRPSAARVRSSRSSPRSCVGAALPRRPASIGSRLPVSRVLIGAAGSARRAAGLQCARSRARRAIPGCSAVYASITCRGATGRSARHRGDHVAGQQSRRGEPQTPAPHRAPPRRATMPGARRRVSPSGTRPSPSCSGRGVTAAENGRPDRSPCTTVGLETSRPAIRSSAFSGVPAARSAIAVITSPGRSAPAAGPLRVDRADRDAVVGAGRRGEHRVERLEVDRRCVAGTRGGVSAARAAAASNACCRHERAAASGSHDGAHERSIEREHERPGARPAPVPSASSGTSQCALVTCPPGLPNNGRIARSARDGLGDEEVLRPGARRDRRAGATRRRGRRHANDRESPEIIAPPHFEEPRVGCTQRERPAGGHDDARGRAGTAVPARNRPRARPRPGEARLRATGCARLPRPAPGRPPRATDAHASPPA